MIKLFKNEALSMLTTDIENNIEKYSQKEPWLDDYFSEKGLGVYSFNSGNVVDDVDLVVGDSSTDFKNSVTLYEAFKDHLSPISASDLRLWGLLAHERYWNYMKTRWSIDKPDEGEDEAIGKERAKLISRIGSRYFFKASQGKAFVRQGISRLYWGAYLSYDMKNSNPYEYTEYLFGKQDLFVAATERSLARNRIIILSALKVLKNNPDISRQKVREFFLAISQAGALTLLDSLEEEDAIELSKRCLDEVMNP